MAKHEFGILAETPRPGKIFDEYEPEKFNCISIDDDYIYPLLEQLSELLFYWHSIDVPGRSLAYCGITLIPPETAKAMLNITGQTNELNDLSDLLEKAVKAQVFVIHFGI